MKIRTETKQHARRKVIILWNIDEKKNTKKSELTSSKDISSIEYLLSGYRGQEFFISEGSSHTEEQVFQRKCKVFL